MDTNEKIITCAKCGSTERVIPRVKVADVTHGAVVNLHLSQDTHPEALLFKGTVTPPIWAKVCCDCGHVELFIDTSGNEWEVTAKQLWEAYMESQKSES
jgi:hypothetical protein